jgi:chemotaxis methyl-accepting protein methylase
MEFEEFLREASKILGLKWRPFKRRGIRRKVEQRIAEVGLFNFEKYLLRVKESKEEQNCLSRILIVTISRFFRDREVFHIIETSIIPSLIHKRKGEGLRFWSIGCASGEEPYSLLLLWKSSFQKIWPQIHLSIIATDIDENMLERAKAGRYRKSSLREVPEEIIKEFFKIDGDFFVLDKTIRDAVEFRRHDILREEPYDGMDMILCRNLAFTYFSKESQKEVLRKIGSILSEDGYLIIGKEESLPLLYPTEFTPLFQSEKIYRKLRFPSFE